MNPVRLANRIVRLGWMLAVMLIVSVLASRGASAQTPTLNALVTFNGTNGSIPEDVGSLAADVNGNLFGTTAGGGGGARPDMAARRSKSPVLASRYRYLRRLPEPLVARRRPRKRR